MVGDVNIFLTDPTDLSLAEMEIMIAGGNDSKSHEIIVIIIIFKSESHKSFVSPRAQLQREGHREGGDTHDDVLRWVEETETC